MQQTLTRADAARAAAERRAKFYPSKPAPGLAAILDMRKPPESEAKSAAIAKFRRYVISHPKREALAADKLARADAQIAKLEQLLAEVRDTALVVEEFPGARRPTLRQIVLSVSRFYDVPVNDLKSVRRTKQVARARQVIMYLAREMTPLSMPQIGNMLGNRDHTTVLHGIRSTAARIEKDGDFAEEVAAIRATILEALGGSEQAV